MKRKNTYLYFGKEKIEIGKEIYTEFNRLVCQQYYSERCYMKHTIPLNTTTDNSNLEDEVIKEILIEKLYSALNQLTDEESRLIF